MTNKTNTKKETEKNAPANPTGKTNWVTTLLMYPALALALISAVPDWMEKYKAWSVDIEQSKLADALEQNRIWRQNLGCASAPPKFFRSNRDELEVDATICKSGDLFIQYKRDNQDLIYRWVVAESFLESKEITLFNRVFDVSSAYAATYQPLAVVSQNSPRVICQKFIDDRIVLRHIKANNACYDEYVDTLTGRITKRNSVQCRSSC